MVHEVVPVTPEQLPEGYSPADFRSLGESKVIRRVDHVREHLVVVEYLCEKLATRPRGGNGAVGGCGTEPSCYSHRSASLSSSSHKAADLPASRATSVGGRSMMPRTLCQ